MKRHDSEDLKPARPTYQKAELLHIDSTLRAIPHFKLPLNQSIDANFSNSKNFTHFEKGKLKLLDSVDDKSLGKAARKDSSVHKSLDYESLDRIRRAYSAALQTQLYTRDMIGRIAKGDFSATLDKNTNLNLQRDSKRVYANLVPFER